MYANILTICSAYLVNIAADFSIFDSKIILMILRGIVSILKD